MNAGSCHWKAVRETESWRCLESRSHERADTVSQERTAWVKRSRCWKVAESGQGSYCFNKPSLTSGT